MAVHFVDHVCSSYIPCQNGQCIESNLWCDDQSSCADGSDEINCGKNVFHFPTCCNVHFICFN